MANQSDSVDFQLYGKSDYLHDIIKRIAGTRAGDKVTLVSMAFDPVEPDIAKLVDTLCAAASREVDVLLLVDAYNFLLSFNGQWVTPGPLFYHRGFPEKTAADNPILLALKRLEAAGGRYTITNMPSRRFSNPFGGRSHIKLTLINDQVYIGGCNLVAASEIDVMIGWNDAQTANWLRGLTEQIHKTGSTQTVFNHSDIEKRLDDKTTLFIDSGKPRQSNIYERALQLIDEATESLYITCQYFPNHITARHLEAAQKRGVKVTVIYNHPGKDFWPFNLLHRVVVMLERLRNPANFFDHELPKGTNFLHAKIIATESAAMVGSHNYVRAGVTWGTAEIALLRHDAAFAKTAIETLRRQLPA